LAGYPFWAASVFLAGNSMKITLTIVMENRSFPFKKRKLTSIVMSTNDSGVDITFSRQGLTEAEHERERPASKN